MAKPTPELAKQINEAIASFESTYNPAEFPYYEPMEEALHYLAAIGRTSDYHFIRVITSFYLGLVASTVRCEVEVQAGSTVPTNIFALALMPSGAGKGRITSAFENEFLAPFTEAFNIAWVEKQQQLIQDKAAELAFNTGMEEEEADKIIRKRIEELGCPMLSFEEATSPAFKQCRSALLLVNYGALNFVVDEVFNMKIESSPILEDLGKSYDKGLLKQKLIKATKEQVRTVDELGSVAANMLLFGVGDELDNPVVHGEFMKRLKSGLARRTLVAYNKDYSPPRMGAVERIAYNARHLKPEVLESITKGFTAMGDVSNLDTVIRTPDDILMFIEEYRVYCEDRSTQITNRVQKVEMAHRYMKAVKLAGAYALYDGSDTMKLSYIQGAIRVVEDATQSVNDITVLSPPHELLAQYLAGTEKPVTQAQLVKALPWFNGTATARHEVFTLAREYGYQNQIAVESFQKRGITFLTAQTMEKTADGQFIVSLSTDNATGYVARRFSLADFAGLKSGFQWCTHYFKGNHRKSSNVVSGFNLLTFDIDEQPKEGEKPYMTLAQMHEVLKGYAHIIYPTKSSTDERNCYRVVMPISNTLYLDKETYRSFMHNANEWFPAVVDEQTAQRSRKWAFNTNATTKVHKGPFIDIFKFLPETDANDDYKDSVAASAKTFEGNPLAIVKWLATAAPEIGRNNACMRLVLLLKDKEETRENIIAQVKAFNEALDPPLEDSELNNTVFKTL
jgi:hypothetical protein